LKKKIGNLKLLELVILYLLEIVIIRRIDVQMILEIMLSEQKLEIEIKIVSLKEKIHYLIEKLYGILHEMFQNM
jgi:hypothetical protein